MMKNAARTMIVIVAMLFAALRSWSMTLLRGRGGRSFGGSGSRSYSRRAGPIPGRALRNRRRAFACSAGAGWSGFLRSMEEAFSRFAGGMLFSSLGFGGAGGGFGGGGIGMFEILCFAPRIFYLYHDGKKKEEGPSPTSPRPGRQATEQKACCPTAATGPRKELSRRLPRESPPSAGRIHLLTKAAFTRR